jgi:hypothetical protein
MESMPAESCALEMPTDTCALEPVLKKKIEQQYKH